MPGAGGGRIGEPSGAKCCGEGNHPRTTPLGPLTPIGDIPLPGGNGLKGEDSLSWLYWGLTPL